MVDISVLLPVYNVEKYLNRCLDSIFGQTFKGSYEVICVNDGSTDKSGKLLEYYAMLHKNLKIINQENQGLSQARNAGVKNASGKYIMFVDSDDFIARDALECLYNYAQLHASEVVIFNFHSGTPDVKNVQTSHYRKIANKYGDKTFNIDNADSQVYRYVPVATWAKFYRADLIKDLLFEPGLNNQDVPYWDLVYTKATRVNYYPRPFYFYCKDREDAITSIKGKKIFDVFKAFSLSRDILRQSGHFEKLKNVHYAHFTCNLIMRLQKINPDLREEFINRLKQYDVDIDYDNFAKDDFYPFEKYNMQLFKYMRENDYPAIESHLKMINLWK